MFELATTRGTYTFFKKMFNKKGPSYSIYSRVEKTRDSLATYKNGT